MESIRRTEIEVLVELLREARRVLVFTGAGISTGSGIADFRGPQGIWKRRQPVYFDEFLASEAKRIEHWDYKVEGWPSFRDAVPTATHRAIVRLERLGRLEAVVTQNIDGLHQKAGSSSERLVEIHGTNREIECLECGARSAPEPAVERFLRERSAPRCVCGGWLKFATISFGQALDGRVLERACQAARNADLALSLGSTLSVHPAASVPLLAVERDVPYAIINQGETEQDALATLRIEGNVDDFLPAAVDALEPRAGAD